MKITRDTWLYACHIFHGIKTLLSGIVRDTSSILGFYDVSFLGFFLLIYFSRARRRFSRHFSAKWRTRKKRNFSKGHGIRPIKRAQQDTFRDDARSKSLNGLLNHLACWPAIKKLDHNYVFSTCLISPSTIWKLTYFSQPVNRLCSNKLPGQLESAFVRNFFSTPKWVV